MAAPAAPREASLSGWHTGAVAVVAMTFVAAGTFFSRARLAGDRGAFGSDELHGLIASERLTIAHLQAQLASRAAACKPPDSSRRSMPPFAHLPVDDGQDPSAEMVEIVTEYKE
ncbi:hypothetical protein DIPPA_34335, partial [Diplonema papillatum]